MLVSDSLLKKEEIDAATVVDVHAPAQTYYTTGNNSGSNINRLRTLSVSLSPYIIKYAITDYFFLKKKNQYSGAS